MQLAVEFAKECERLIDQYVQRVTDHVLFKVGKCWPLSQAYNTTSAVICQQIFWPFVSFFFFQSIFCRIRVFVSSLFKKIKLDSLFSLYFFSFFLNCNPFGLLTY